MELDLWKLYRPITALPFQQDGAYFEVPPCLRLSPYIPCFWGGDLTGGNRESRLRQDRLIIPDGCRDLILTLRDGQIEVRLTDLDVQPSRVRPQPGGNVRNFGVRFFFWAVPCFCGEHLVEEVSRRLEQSEFAALSFAGQTVWMEEALLACFRPEELRPRLLEAAGLLVNARGNLSVEELARQTFQSQRTLQRQFLRTFGVSPKTLAGIVRYQSLWRDLCTKPDFDIHDEVAALGFYDQAHLLHTFSRYHGMNLTAALRYGRDEI